MRKEFIAKQDAVDAIDTNADDLEQNGGIPFAQGARAMAIVVEQMSSADVVPVSAYKQVMWERDTAVEQLKQIGKGLGEVMDDVVQVVRCKECKFYTSMRPDIKTGICDLNVHYMEDDGFCSCGERRG